jgi:general secretion pathway protein D
MFMFNRLGRVLASVALALSLSQVAAPKPRKAQKLVEQGRAAEDRKDLDKALELYERAVMENPRDTAALILLRRVRFQCGQAHVDKGQKLRAEGKLEEALSEFQKAYSIDPASSIAEQEVRRTRQMIEREKKSGEKLTGEDRGMTPVQRARQEVEERIASALPAPELKPISSAPITLRMNNQPPKVLFETVGKLAGINVIMDPDQGGMSMGGMGGAQRNLSIELTNASIEEALDYLAVLTKSFWKPLSPNTILVAQDNPTKRRDFEDLVVKVFYLTNITVAQDLNEIAAAVRGVTDIRRLYTCGAQNAIIVRGTVDQVGLAEKLIQDMDKPKAEVVVEVIVMEASRNKTRDLAAALASGGTAGLNTPISFTPRNGVTTTGSGSTGTGTTTTTTSSITLAQVGKLASSDFSMTMPGALVKALMTDSDTRVLQKPQVRAADGQKASLRIGDKTPIASGSFSSGMSTQTGLLASTQFQFVDVGVNVDMTPKIHGPDEVSLHIELEISSVKDRIDIGGISQPIIGQRKVVHDIRIREGEINILGGLMQGQQSRTTGGFPGLSSIPGLKWLFSTRSTTNSESELLIVLIPHIVRAPEITDVNLKGVAAGTDQAIRLNFAPRKTAAPAEPTKTPAGTKPAALPGAPVETKPAAPEAPAVSPAGLPLPLPAPAAPPKVSFTPSAVNVQTGATVMLRLEIANGVDVFAAPFRLKFDPKVLRLKDVTDGGIIGGDGRRPIFMRNIRNDVGEAAVILNRLPGAGGVSGTGSLAMMEFQVVGPGQGKVSLQEFGLKDSKMQPIQVTLPEVTVNAR